MMNVSRLQEGQDVVKMLRIAQAHGFAIAKTPQPKSRSSEIVPEINALLCSIIVSSVSHMRMLTRKMPCDIGTKHVAITFEIVAQCMRA